MNVRTRQEHTPTHTHLCDGLEKFRRCSINVLDQDHEPLVLLKKSHQIVLNVSGCLHTVHCGARFPASSFTSINGHWHC